MAVGIDVIQGVCHVILMSQIFIHRATIAPWQFIQMSLLA
jgi:hypothetical protein